MAKFCILGSGIAGLSTAYYLKKNNPSSTIVILEEQHKAGGVIDSDPFGDCVVEWGPRGVRPKGNGQFVLEMVEASSLFSLMPPVPSRPTSCWFATQHPPAISGPTGRSTALMVRREPSGGLIRVTDSPLGGQTLLMAGTT